VWTLCVAEQSRLNDPDSAWLVRTYFRRHILGPQLLNFVLVRIILANGEIVFPA
jgi:hypothetical protein